MRSESREYLLASGSTAPCGVLHEVAAAQATLPLRPRTGTHLPITILSNRFTLRRIHKYQKKYGATLFGESMKFRNHNTNIIN